MKKIILAAAFFASSVNANPLTWIDDYASMSTTHEVIATVYETKSMGYNVRFIMKDTSCNSFESEVKQARNHDVNGVMVKFASQCLDADLMAFFPYTSAGIDYVVGQFKSQNTVTINGVKFDASGFTKAYLKYTAVTYAI